MKVRPVIHGVERPMRPSESKGARILTGTIKELPSTSNQSGKALTPGPELGTHFHTNILIARQAKSHDRRGVDIYRTKPCHWIATAL